jgi:hypothetical protein
MAKGKTTSAFSAMQLRMVRLCRTMQPATTLNATSAKAGKRLRASGIPLVNRRPNMDNDEAMVLLAAACHSQIEILKQLHSHRAQAPRERSVETRECGAA